MEQNKTTEPVDFKALGERLRASGEAAAKAMQACAAAMQAAHRRTS